MTNSGWLAWCAGVFDCRGTIGISRARSGRYTVMVRAETTYREKIERLQLILGEGTGTARPRGPRPGRQPTWNWYCETSEQVRILHLIEPYLMEKKYDASLALELLENDLTLASNTAFIRHRRGRNQSSGTVAVEVRKLLNCGTSS